MIEPDGIYWEGIHKPAWNTRDLLAAHLLRIPEGLIDLHKEWDSDQCEIGPDCRYCPTLPTERTLQ